MSLLHPTDGTLREAQSAFLDASAAASHALYKLDHLMPRKQLEVWLGEAVDEVQARAKALRQQPPTGAQQGPPAQQVASESPSTPNQIGPGI